MFKLLVAVFVFSMVIGQDQALPGPSVGDRVIARWTNNLYYRGKVNEYSDDKYTILFDDGDKIRHRVCDISAMIQDSCPQNVIPGQHVIAKKKGGVKYYIGYVKEISQGQNFLVRFDDDNEVSYKKCDLRIFPEHLSPFNVGARVFARWTNGLYYNGFVTKTKGTSVFINYDDGDTIWLTGKDAVILDKLENPESIKVGQRVIGYWPKRVRYYPGTVISRRTGTYFIRYDDGDQRRNEIYEIRDLPKSG